MTTKITKKDNFNTLLGLDAVKSNPTLVAFIEHELELLSRKNSKGADRALTPTQKQNEQIMAFVYDGLCDAGSRMTIGEMLKEFDFSDFELGENGMTNQKLSAILHKLVDNGKVIRTEEKRKVYFSVA